ncbi:MAG: bifunctional diaminohydroxyphosphoribosylaminopyrimidine deaminase/5-amino-6-(5-phosphoribosylamino)uracil reductase RibD [Gammaproteobacteria bacterium]|nr:MAG: bifunctional diaminohydroxyphosphoribosylaminopyrimidine deaminase/5-amino-6-(5-phosphoribosylamino)uracil reductase RibD [Gammaproteobacteria bacterium]
MSDSLDAGMMARALQLAARGCYTTMPNPAVGCVIARGDEVVGEGWHQRAGEPHAEVHALRAAGARAKGASAYVSLEPCSHHGRTPPCADALIEAGVARVVYGMQDPNPNVAGRGLEKLRQAGITVDGPLLEAEARALNRGFIKRQQQQLPRVTVKLAMSLDGRTAMASGESQWITGPAARSDVQRLRARSSAIVTGLGTVVHDNPALTVRAVDLGLENAEEIVRRQPLRVVVDSQLRIPRDCQLLGDSGATLVASATGGELPGAEVVALDNGSGRVDLKALLGLLAQRECNEVLVEAGAELAGAFVAAGLADELVVYMAPKLLGSAARPLLTLPLQAMSEAQDVEIVDIRAIGDDWRITARPCSGE